MTLLETITSPEDLKRLPLDKLPDLAKEIRQQIVQTVNGNGGHLASNLGTVELTIALHRVFESPKDIILFDVSHQSYTHKMLTGRAQRFAGIRTSGGYSGYFDKDESPHDILTLGHAGCAPSLALGLALGKKLNREEGIVIAVLGDGSLTNGLAYEGLSNIVVQNPENLIVILNDNGMAINQNVGWMATWRNKWLPHLRNQLEIDPDFKDFERITQKLSAKVPAGGLFLDLARGMKSAVEKAVIPGIGQYWEEMGFKYVGPVDGHDLPQLIEYLHAGAMVADKVPFIHVITDKGHGSASAQADPVRYHQPGPVTALKKKQTYSGFFGAALADLMAKNDKIVAISAAMLEGTGLAPVKKLFPDRVFDVGICEEHAVSMAAGMARAGLRPIVCIYSTFLQRALDQIIHDVCMNDLPVVFALDRSGLVGQDGKTHHGLFDLAYMRIAPNMVVAAPWNEKELGDLLTTAFMQSHPFSLRYPKGEIPCLLDSYTFTPIVVGASQTVYGAESSGIDDDLISLVAVGSMVAPALEARLILKEENISVGVVNLRYIKPIDSELVCQLCENYSDVIVLEEGTSTGGAAAALLEAMTESYDEIPTVQQLSTGDSFPDHGEVPELKQQLGLDAQAIVSKVREIISGGA
jgi:1-deoxy-D-xylulose-5-phosphate synthase